MVTVACKMRSHFTKPGSWFFSGGKLRYELLSGPYLQFRRHRDKRLSYYTKSRILIAFKIAHQIKSPARCRNEISVVLTLRKGICVGTVGSFSANVKFQFMKIQRLKSFPLLFYPYPTFYSSITDVGPIALESAGYHFEVWQGPILRWHLHVIAYDRMLPTPSPEGWKLERPLASLVLLLSPSHRWTWTRLVLEAEAGAVIDFSPRSDFASSSQATAAFLLQQTDEEREVYSQESQCRQMGESHFISTW